jgi:hypothetical protein
MDSKLHIEKIKGSEDSYIVNLKKFIKKIRKNKERLKKELNTGTFKLN